MQPTVYAAPPPLGMDINTLDPPELPIPPITPFIRDKALSNHLTSRVLSDIERPPIGPLEDSQRALPQPVGVQGPLFRFPGHGGTEARQRLDILDASGPYRDVFKAHRRSA
jgi:hypothetical protein